jgi:hypothetical protein
MPNPTEQLLTLYAAHFAPDPLYIAKPRPTDPSKGRAVKAQLRLAPVYVANPDTPAAGYFDRDANKQGGLFIEIATQQGQNAAGNATFGWTHDSLVRAKLGRADLGKLVWAYHAVRERGEALPKGIADTKTPSAVGLPHKFNGQLTIITYDFGQGYGDLQVSKVTENRRQSIRLSIDEEFQLFRYLGAALDRFHQVGKR